MNIQAILIGELERKLDDVNDVIKPLEDILKNGNDDDFIEESEYCDLLEIIEGMVAVQLEVSNDAPDEYKKIQYLCEKRIKKYSTQLRYLNTHKQVLMADKNRRHNHE